MDISRHLKTIQTAQQLNEMYGASDYYGYLHCPEFEKKVLRPLGRIVRSLGVTCLDIGCGEGQMYPYIGHDLYHGFDASENAVNKAMATYPHGRFELSRIEDFLDHNVNTFGTLLFGNILWLLVHTASYAAFVEAYRTRLRASYVIIYDLERLDCSDLDAHVDRIDEFHVTVDVPQIPDIKRHRKVVVYKC